MGFTLLDEITDETTSSTSCLAAATVVQWALRCPFAVSGGLLNGSVSFTVPIFDWPFCPGAGGVDPLLFREEPGEDVDI